jgi:hypothetical protein
MRLSISAALGVLLLARTAAADPASDAKDLFERGRALRSAGKCDEAAPLFEKAAEIFPAGLGSLRNAAECEETLGHFATARRLWGDLKRAVMLSNDPKYEGWQADAEAAAARLEPKLAHVTVDVVESDGKMERKLGPKNHVTVTLGSEPLPPALVGTSLDRDPGPYVVTVTGLDGAPKSQAIELRVGDAKTLRFVVPAPPPEPASTKPTPIDERGPTTRRTLGWIGVGVGAAALVGAGISLGVRQAALSDLKSACPAYESAPCPTSVESTVGRGATASTLVNVLGIGGGVLLVTGVVLVLVSPDPKPAAALVPRVGVGLASITAEWSFR